MDPREPRPRKFPGEKPLAPAPRMAPELTLPVVEWLEQMYPPLQPRHDCPHGSLMHGHGQLDVVRRVRAEYERQQKEAD